MLHERTSSAINLRMQSSRRHAIRNLKAKVRSMLPTDICPRQKRRYHRSEKLDNYGSLYRKEEDHSQSHLHDRKRNKIFEKLTKKEIEEINQNKHYFLGNEESIAFYESYVKQCYPELIEQGWAPPNIQIKALLPFAFIPSNLINPQQIPTYKKIASQKRLFDKRSSGCRSIGLLKKQSIPLIESRAHDKTDIKLMNEKGEACINRKQARQEQQKIKRQINSVYLQRQQQMAEQRKNKTLKQRSQVAKKSYSSTYHSNNLQKVNWYQSKSSESDIINLTAQLRRVCIQRRKNQTPNQSP